MSPRHFAGSGRGKASNRLVKAREARAAEARPMTSEQARRTILDCKAKLDDARARGYDVAGPEADAVDGAAAWLAEHGG